MEIATPPAYTAAASAVRFLEAMAARRAPIALGLSCSRASATTAHERANGHIGAREHRTHHHLPTRPAKTPEPILESLTTNH